LISALQALIMLTVFAGAHAAAAAPETIDTNDKNNENNQIRITADKLVAEVDAGEIEFIGNVKATHKTESIEKIIANGHVKIVIDNIIVETDRAEYTIKSEVLVLLGEQSSVTQGGHSISGTKFTLNRFEGKLTVESSGENRVKAILQPAGKDK